MEEDVTPITFSPDGALLASGHQDGTLRLWDVDIGTERRCWQSGALAVRGVAFSPDGKSLASGVALGSICLWDVATGSERHPSDEPHGFIDFVRFSSDGASLVSTSRDPCMLWWDLTTQTPRRRFTWTAKGFSRFALSPDGNSLAVGSWADFKARLWEVRLWDARTGKPGRLLGKYKGGFWPIVFSPDGRLLAWGEEEDGIHVRDVREGTEVRHIKGFTSGSMSLCFSPDSKALACAIWKRGQRSLRLWEVDNGKEKVELPCFDTFAGPLAFSPDGKVLAVGGNNSNFSGESFVRLWDTATGEERNRHTGHKEPVGAIAFSPGGKLVASGSGSLGTKDNSVHVWEAATGQLIRRFEGHHSCVDSLAFSPDGRTVASGAGDSTILLWDITGRQQDGMLRPAALTPHELDDCWTTLAKEDAAKAYDGVWRLVAAPEQAVPFLQKHLHPVPRPDAKRVARLIAGLDSDDFKVRQRATEELTKFDDAIAPDLRRALDGKPALELRHRLRQLLDQTRGWNAERLRNHRAIQALEHIGTRQAKDGLEALAGGAPGAKRTEEAKAALQRLKR